jgi:FkbM family methyltransferase
MAFTVREATKRRVVGTYSLAHRREAVILMRHDGLDAWTLEEIFGLKVYALPAVVSARLKTVPGEVRVLDLGANIGLAALFLSQELPLCSGVAFEPDPLSAEMLARCLSANHLSEQWTVVNACAGNYNGFASFMHGQSAVSHTVDPLENGAIEVPVRDVLEDLGRADLAKIDIEGAEWQLLTDPRFVANAPVAMVIEYHAEHCPSADPRSMALELLARAGYQTQDVSFPAHAALPDGQGVVWAWRGAH